MDNKIFETTDVFNNKVVLLKDVYENHIIKGHPEMKDSAEFIKNTIEQPTVVYKSTVENRLVYFKLGANKKYSNKIYTKAVVEYDKNNGSVTTSFLERDIQGVDEGGLIYANPKY